MVVTWQIFTEYIRLYFANPHLDIKKFGAEFLEQLDNIADKGENFPILYISPDTIVVQQNVLSIAFVATCLDYIQDGRENIDTVLSTTQTILNDLYQWMNNADHIGFMMQLTGSATMSPMNNATTAYLAGWQMNISVDVPTSTLCDIPGITV